VKKRLVSKALEERMNVEAEGADPKEMARFKREHGGMTPTQFALAQFPKSTAAATRAFPHLAPPKKRGKPPPAGSR
jgi:hypothetical protein